MSLQSHFESLSDAELLQRIESGGLTQEATDIASVVARARGLSPAIPSTADPDSPESPHEYEMAILERGLSPQEAQVLAGFLRSAGIAADAGDTNTVQANALLSIAVGGARLSVPQAHLKEAQDLLEAYRRGDFDIGDDFEPGEAEA